jgi:hypothetical protein
MNERLLIEVEVFQGDEVMVIHSEEDVIKMIGALATLTEELPPGTLPFIRLNHEERAEPK